MFIANWKMEKTFEQSIEWIKKFKFELEDTLNKTNSEIVICPSFDAIQKISKILNKTSIKIGAQNCASEELGAYTGEVSALSLKEIGCHYCIVGHSERRVYFKETNKIINKKIKILLKNLITPIICIGETEKEKLNNKTFSILEEQLNFALELPQDLTNNEIIIAYEPVWAIGTGKNPTKTDLDQIINWIIKFIDNNYSKIKYSILYGGSINEKNIEKFKKIDYLKGFLIGSASLDFQILKKIVLLFYNN